MSGTRDSSLFANHCQIGWTRARVLCEKKLRSIAAGCWTNPGKPRLREDEKIFNRMMEKPAQLLPHSSQSCRNVGISTGDRVVKRGERTGEDRWLTRPSNESRRS